MAPSPSTRSSDWLRRYVDIAANAAKSLPEFLDDLKTIACARNPVTIFGRTRSTHPFSEKI
jgi:hypothetical protein